MLEPTISIIAAIGSNRELGKDNKLLWHIGEDLARFKQLTLGHPVIMGRTTYESIGKPLPGRLNIILTRDKDFKAPGCRIARSLKEAVEKAQSRDSREIFIIGGGNVYQQAIKMADKLYLTIVKGTFSADTFFPEYSDFKKILYKKKSSNDKYKYTFLELVKI